MVSDVAAILSPLTTLSDLASKFMALRVERKRLDNAEKADRRQHEERKQLARLQAAVLDNASQRASVVELERVRAEHAASLRSLAVSYDLGRRDIQERTTHALAAVHAYRDVELRRVEAELTVALASLATDRRRTDQWFRAVEGRDATARRGQRTVERAMEQAVALMPRPTHSAMAHETVRMLARILSDMVTRRHVDELFFYVLLNSTPGGTAR